MSTALSSYYIRRVRDYSPALALVTGEAQAIWGKAGSVLPHNSLEINTAGKQSDETKAA